MKMLMLSVYDSKAEAFDKPFFIRSKGEALRGWEDEANNSQSIIGKHPEDFTLFEIGTVDVLTGTVIPHDAKISLGIAIEYKKSNEALQLKK